MYVKRIYVRPAKVQSPEVLKDRALKMIDSMMKSFDLICYQNGACDDEAMSVYDRLLGNIEMAEALGVITSAECHKLLVRARDHKDSWLDIFGAPHFLYEDLEDPD